MAVFHSLPYNGIQRLIQIGGIVAGDIYFANDTQQTFIAATDGSLVPTTSIIMSGNITGEPGADGPPGPTGADGADGTPGAQGEPGSTSQNGMVGV